MSVTSVDKDPQRLTMTVTSRFDAPAAAVWQLWADPRKLERWWGPPTYPATVVDHDLTPGGRVSYYMTGPDGDQPHGWWDVTAVDPPHRLELTDGFADADGRPSDAMPTMRMVVAISETGGATTMTIETTFPSVEAMDQLLGMGMEEGITAALGQADALLEPAASTT